MKNIRNRVLAATLAVVSLLGLSVGPSVFAASTGDGMRVAPVKASLVMQPGTSKTVSVYVSNVTGSAAKYTVVKNDFVASEDESGTPALLLNGEENDKHGLKRYMSAVSEVSVGSKQQAEVKVTISLPKDIAGGGYYGAIRFVPGTSTSGDTNLSLSGSVASLILVRVPGDVVEKMSLVSFDARQGEAPDDTSRTVYTSNKDIYATVRFRNEGNIQEEPFGKIVLKKGDTIVKQFEINKVEPPANVLPDSIRKFQVKLTDVGSFGKYTLEGNFGYGSAGQLLTAKTTFYVIPGWAIALGLLVIALILFLVFGLPRLVRSYNKRVLRKAGRR